METDNEPKHSSKDTREFHKAKKFCILQQPSQSPDPNTTKHVIQLLKTKLTAASSQP